MTPKIKALLFSFFLVSGFCGLVYQVVWIRLAYASFGVISPVLSVILSVFMLGLALGSWLGGRSINGLCERFGVSALVFYAFGEVLIGSGAFIVPKLFSAGQTLLYNSGPSNSLSYLAISALAISASILPWCFFMGLTFPFMMAYVKELARAETHSFSFLYSANVIGAALGAFASGFVMVELLGFRATLAIAAVLNFAVAAASFALSRRAAPPGRAQAAAVPAGAAGVDDVRLALRENLLIWILLFSTGFISMSMEVVWVRAFAPALGNRTYSFAALLIVYLFATWAGSTAYRRHVARGRTIGTDRLLLGLTVFAFLPIVMNDPRELLIAAPLALISIMPFCAALGYLTPGLIDRYSAGHPDRGGKAYGINVLGCILGPLASAYLLLPALGVKLSLVLLAVPFILFFLAFFGRQLATSAAVPAMLVLACVLCVMSFTVHTTYEEQYAGIPGAEVRRDYAATVVSMGQGMDRVLLVNGEGAAYLLMENKVQAHLPLLFHQGEPRTVLDICFGAGTAFRSLLSWGVEVTSVELVPSVADAFGFYFDDADELLDLDQSHVIIDDGRRFLARNKESYDVIVVDPPSPVEAAGSSLLYTEEFYRMIRSRLKQGGVLQQWIPHAEVATVAAATQALVNSFPHVRAFRSYNGWGHHFVAAEHPLPDPDLPARLAAMPESARRDLTEWAEEEGPLAVANRLLAQEVPLAQLIAGDPEAAITDDRPINEYYFLRRLWAKLTEGEVRYTH